MHRLELLTFMRAHTYAVLASVSEDGHAQAAVIGVAVSDAFEIVFDTVATTRKVPNLRANSRVALVIGGAQEGAERTVQYEGLAYEPSNQERDRVLALYLSRFPEGRERLAWPGITHFVVTPTWIRFSDFARNPPHIQEFDRRALDALR